MAADQKVRAMDRWLARWVECVQRRAGLVLTIAAAGGLCSALWAATSLGFKTSRSDLIDPNDQTHRNWVRCTQEFGDDADIIFTAQGPDRGRIIAALETLARDIVAQPEFFEKTCHRINVDKLKAKGLYQLPAASLERIAAHVEQMKPLLWGGWRLLSIENLLGATQLRLAAAKAGQPLDFAASDAAKSSTALLDALATSLELPAVYRSAWRAAFADITPSNAQEIPDYFFSRDGRLGFLRTIPRKNAESFTGFTKPVSVARAIVARTGRAFPDLRFGLTGLPVLEDDEMQAAQQASGWSTVLSIVGVALLFFLGFKAIRHPLLGIVALAISGSWTLGFVTLTVGHLNILSVAFIVTLIGMGIDYGIVWMSRYEAQRARGADNAAANVAAAATVGPGILTSAITTATAFFTTMATGFLGLKEMGWIAGGGILICMAGTFTFLPALLTLLGRSDLKIKDRFASERPFWPALQRRPRLIMATFAIVAAGLALGIPRVRMDYNLLNLQSRGLPSVELEHELIERTGSSGFYALSVADSAESAIALRRQFERQPSVGRVVEIASLVPINQESKSPVIAGIQRSLATLPSKSKPPRFGESTLAGINKQVAQWCVDAATPVALADAARRFRDVLTRISETEAERRLARFERRWGIDLVEQLNELKSAATPIPVTFDDLPTVLKERYRSPSGKYLVQVFPKESVWDMPPLRAFVADLESVDPRVTGHPVTAMHSLSKMTEGYANSAQLALAVIFASVLVDFRNWRVALLAMLPLALGCIGMLGIMGWTGLAFNPANMIALPLILGVGVNYGVYMIHDFRQSTADEYFLCRRLARAIGLSALTTIVGFASLLCAQHWGMISIGLVLSIGVAACLLNVLFLMPPLLNATMRRAKPAILPFPTVERGSHRQAA